MWSLKSLFFYLFVIHSFIHSFIRSFIQVFSNSFSSFHNIEKHSSSRNIRLEKHLKKSSLRNIKSLEHKGKTFSWDLIKSYYNYKLKWIKQRERNSSCMCLPKRVLPALNYQMIKTCDDNAVMILSLSFISFSKWLITFHHIIHAKLTIKLIIKNLFQILFVCLSLFNNSLFFILFSFLVLIIE